MAHRHLWRLPTDRCLHSGNARLRQGSHAQLQGITAASFSVSDAGVTLFSGNYVANPGYELGSGNALQLGVTALPEAGVARMEAAITNVGGQSVAGAIATRGDATYSESQLTWFLPDLLQAFTAQGTLRLTFPAETPPAGDQIRFGLGAGNVTCQ